MYPTVAQSFPMTGMASHPMGHLNAQDMAAQRALAAAGIPLFQPYPYYQQQQPQQPYP
jgi:hypothetical protein